MPNWTSNRIVAPKAVIEKYLSKDEKGYDCFDFNLIIQRPKIYDDPDLVAGGDMNDCIYWYLSERGNDTYEHITCTFPDIFRDYFGFLPNGNTLKQLSDEKSDEYYRRGKKYVDAYMKYGYKNWYDWSNANWGTKWNACDSHVSDDCTIVEFETAWCYPEPIIKRIFMDNPDCVISFTWSNEDYDGTHTIYRDSEGIMVEWTDWEEEMMAE